MISGRSHVLASVFVLGFVTLACKGASKTVTSAASASATASAVPSASAKPAFVDPTRYPDEIELAGAVHTKKAVAARQSADATSKVVANLAEAFEVGLVVAHGAFVLVSVTDDGVAGQLGWVPLDTFGDVPQLASAKTGGASKPRPPKNVAHCGPKEIAAGSGGTRCLKRCSAQGDCGEGESCDLLGYWTADGPRNGKACHDIMNGGEEVLSPFKGAPSDTSGTRPAVKCKDDEIEDGNRCLAQCTTDKDCKKGLHCEQMKVPNPSGGTSTAMVCE